MQTTKQPTSPFKVNQLICGGLISGIVFFMLISFSFRENFTSEYDPDDFMLPISFMILMMGSVAALYLVKRFLEPEDNNLNAKLSNYQTRMIIRMALLEGPAILAIVQFFSTGSLWYAVIPVFSIILMIYLFPSRSKFVSEYELSFEEKKAFDKIN